MKALKELQVGDTFICDKHFFSTISREVREGDPREGDQHLPSGTILLSIKESGKYNYVHIPIGDKLTIVDLLKDLLPGDTYSKKITFRNEAGIYYSSTWKGLRMHCKVF